MTRSTMPIMGATIVSEIPFALIAPHDAQARSNHGGQNLDKLASRGGLSACEALAILENRRWHAMPDSLEAQRLLINKVRDWRAAQRS